MRIDIKTYRNNFQYSYHIQVVAEIPGWRCKPCLESHFLILKRGQVGAIVYSGVKWKDTFCITKL